MLLIRTVAAEVESVSHRDSFAFAAGECDGSGAAPAGELRLGGEPERVADFDDQRGRGDGADAGLVAQRGAVLVEEPGQFALEPADLGERLTVLVDEGAQP